MNACAVKRYLAVQHTEQIQTCKHNEWTGFRAQREYMPTTLRLATMMRKQQRIIPYLP